MTFKPLLIVMMACAGMTGLRAQIDTILRMDHGPAYEVGATVYDHEKNVIFALGLTYGAWRSADGGLTFESAAEGFPGSSYGGQGPFFVNDSEFVLVDQTAQGPLFYRSLDQGRTFTMDEVQPGPTSGAMLIWNSVMWYPQDSLLSINGGRDWTKLDYPLALRWPRILSEHRIAVGDSRSWREYDTRTREWTVINIPASGRETYFERVDDSRFLWVDSQGLVVGAGTGGPTKRIDSMYLPGRGVKVGLSVQRTFKHHNRTGILDRSGRIGLLDGDSLIALIEHPFVPQQTNAPIDIRLQFQSIGDTDILIAQYPVQGWFDGVSIEFIDIGQRRNIRSLFVPYLGFGVPTFLLNDMATVAIGNERGEFIRVPGDGSSWTVSGAAGHRSEARPKCAVYDGYVLSDGVVLALNEFGRWIRNDRATSIMEIVFNEGSRVGMPSINAVCDAVGNGYPGAERYGDTVYTTGSAGIKMSIDGMTRDTIAGSLTTYAYRDQDGRLYMGAHDVRWTMNAGLTWTVSSNGLPSRSVNVRPTISRLLGTSKGTMVVGLRGFEQSTNDVIADSVPGGIYYSPDDGISWTKAEGLGERDYILNVAEVGQGELIAVVARVIVDVPYRGSILATEVLAENVALVRSTNGGRTWQVVFEDSTVGRRTFDNHHGTILEPRTGRVIALLSSNAVMASRDNGEHWDYADNAPLSLANITALDADGSGRLHYFTNHGIFRQSTPTSVEDDIIPHDISMNVRIAGGVLHGSFDTPDVTGTTITIVDLQGRAVRSFVTGGEFMTSVAGLPSGLYIVTASGRWGRTSRPLIVAH